LDGENPGEKRAEEKQLRRRAMDQCTNLWEPGGGAKPGSGFSAAEVV